MLALRMGKMALVIFVSSFAGHFFSMPLARIRTYSFVLPMFQMSASGTFRSFRRDYCFTDSVGSTMRAKIWCEYIYSMTVRGRNCVDNW